VSAAPQEVIVIGGGAARFSPRHGARVGRDDVVGCLKGCARHNALHAHTGVEVERRSGHPWALCFESHRIARVVAAEREARPAVAPEPPRAAA
jgi:hypothetical protein